jgi:hypothetical protein
VFMWSGVYRHLAIMSASNADASQAACAIVVALLYGMVMLEGQGLETAVVEQKYGNKKIRNWLRVHATPSRPISCTLTVVQGSIRCRRLLGSISFPCPHVPDHLLRSILCKHPSQTLATLLRAWSLQGLVAFVRHHCLGILLSPSRHVYASQ